MNDIYHSATVKLTFWYLTMAMIISLLFSAVVYHIADNELAAGLHNQTARIYQQYPVFTNDPFFIRSDDVEVGSHHILENLVLANIAVLIGAGIGSYWLAKRTLQPIAAANEQQKQFVADASHELRTPVTALKMATEVALMDTSASPSALRSALNSNLEEVDKLELLLTSLLRLSKLESGELSATFTAVQIEDVIAHAVVQTTQPARAKHITIVSTSKTAITVDGDADSLTQLFVILLDNAIKYSPEKATIHITTQRVENNLQIVIADEGSGIEPEALLHVFDRFYRADKARTSNNGYGLGLAIAKHIADLHQGTITLTSKVGKGTKATVSLPVAIDQPAVSHEPDDTTRQ